MRSEKAWYWLAAGVLALGLNGAYQDGQLGWAHCLAGKATGFVERNAQRGLRYLTMAELMLGRDPEVFGRAQAALQRIQTKAVCQRVALSQQRIAMAHARQQMAEVILRQKLDLGEMKMNQVRMMSMGNGEQLRHCSGLSKIVVDLPDRPKLDLSNLPDIQISDIPEISQAPAAGSRGPI